MMQERIKFVMKVEVGLTGRVFILLLKPIGGHSSRLSGACANRVCVCVKSFPAHYQTLVVVGNTP